MKYDVVFSTLTHEIYVLVDDNVQGKPGVWFSRDKKILGNNPVYFPIETIRELVSTGNPKFYFHFLYEKIEKEVKTEFEEKEIYGEYILDDDEMYVPNENMKLIEQETQNRFLPAVENFKKQYLNF